MAFDILSESLSLVVVVRKRLLNPSSTNETFERVLVRELGRQPALDE
jgi:hypothetical protein